MIVWDDLIAELVACGIGGWDEIEATMTVSRYDALTRYWQRNPPVHRLFAAWVGYEAPQAPSGSSDLADLLDWVGAGGLVQGDSQGRHTKSAVSGDVL